MSDVNYVICDRCKKVINNKDFSIFKRWLHGTMIKDGKSCPDIDLCPRCTEDFERFMDQFVCKKEKKYE